MGTDVRVRRSSSSSSTAIGRFIRLALSFPIRRRSGDSPCTQLRHVLLEYFGTVYRPGSPGRPTRASLGACDSNRREHTAVSTFILLRPSSVGHVADPGFLSSSRSLCGAVNSARPRSVLRHMPGRALASTCIRNALVHSLYKG